MPIFRKLPKGAYWVVTRVRYNWRYSVCSTALLCAASTMTLLNPFQQIFG